MKILISTFSFWPAIDGISSVAANHANGFLSNGHNVSIATTKNEQRYISKDNNEGCNIFEFDICGGPNFNYTGEIENYRKFLLESEFDIIFFHCLHSWTTDCASAIIDKVDAVKVLVSHGYSGNIIYSIKGLLNYLSWSRIKYRLQLKYLLGRFDHIVFLSDKKDKNRFYDFYLVHKFNLSSFSIIPNGSKIIDKKLCELNFRLKFKIRTKYLILSVSQYSKLKNQLMSLIAFKNSKLNDTTLLFIGQNKNKYTNMLKKYIRKNKLNNTILLDNIMQKDITNAYHSADLFLSSSHTETQPIVLLDAMGAGLPFISSNVGCVDAFKGGLISNNVDHMAEQIILLMNDNNKRKQLGTCGTREANEIYNWAIIIKKYEDLIQNYCSQSNPNITSTQ